MLTPMLSAGFDGTIARRRMISDEMPHYRAALLLAGRIRRALARRAESAAYLRSTGLPYSPTPAARLTLLIERAPTTLRCRAYIKTVSYFILIFAKRPFATKFAAAAAAALPTRYFSPYIIWSSRLIYMPRRRRRHDVTLVRAPQYV